MNPTLLRQIVSYLLKSTFSPHYHLKGSISIELINPDLPIKLFLLRAELYETDPTNIEHLTAIFSPSTPNQPLVSRLTPTPLTFQP